MTQNWYQSLESIVPFTFEILTPGGSGTGFQIFTNNKGMCGIATAYHVINHAHEWSEPIKIIHHKSQKKKILKAEPEHRVIFTYPSEDLAFIVFNKGDLPIENMSPEMIDPKTSLKQGVEMGWCGFPNVAPQHKLCFFAGHISCYLSDQNSYLVDGVAIHGVSGGPAFYIQAATGKQKICGVISAYRPNRMTGETLPGLSIVRSVEPYQEKLRWLRSLYEAEEKADEVKKQEVEGMKPPEKVEKVPISKQKGQKKKVAIKKKK